MTQVQLRLPAVLGTELDMLLAALVFHPQLVVCRRADHVAGAVLLRYVVNMAGVMQRMGDIRTVRVALMKRYRHFRALN